MPTWSLCAPTATNCCLSVASLPGRMPITLRAGNGLSAMVTIALIATFAPTSPMASSFRALVNSWLATPAPTNSRVGASGPSTTVTSGRCRKAASWGMTGGGMSSATAAAVAGTSGCVANTAPLIASCDNGTDSSTSLPAACSGVIRLTVSPYTPPYTDSMPSTFSVVCPPITQSLPKASAAVPAMNVLIGSTCRDLSGRFWK